MILDAEWTMTLRHLTLELFRTAQEHGLCGRDRVEQKNSYGDDGEELQLFGERMDRWFVLAFCASRPASLDMTIIIGLAPAEDFESIAVNYNFRRASTKACLPLCRTAN